MSLTASCKGVAGKSFKIKRVLTAQLASGRNSSQIEPTTGVPGVLLGGTISALQRADGRSFGFRGDESGESPVRANNDRLNTVFLPDFTSFLSIAKERKAPVND